MEILGEEVVTDSEAKEILETSAKDGELKYEQKNALEILRKFIKSDISRNRKVTEELKSIPKLRERHIVAIINALPADKDDLRAVLQKEYADFTSDELERIIAIVKKI